MAGLDERLHDLVAAAGREVPVPPPEGVRRRGTRRRVVRAGTGGLAVVLLAVGCLLGVRAVQGPDEAALQPAGSDLPGNVQIEIIPDPDTEENMKLVEADGILNRADAEAEDVNDLWSFPQPDPDRKLYQIKMVSAGANNDCLSSVEDSQARPVLLPCDATDPSQLWEIEPDWDIHIFKGLGPLIGELEPDLLTTLVGEAGGPEETTIPTVTSEPTAS